MLNAQLAIMEKLNDSLESYIKSGRREPYEYSNGMNTESLIVALEEGAKVLKAIETMRSLNLS